jgi:hypothetical protein
MASGKEGAKEPGRIRPLCVEKNAPFREYAIMTSRVMLGIHASAAISKGYTSDATMASYSDLFYISVSFNIVCRLR